MRTAYAPFAALVALVAALSVCGCGLGPDEASGGDEKRVAATKVPLDSIVDDRVSVRDGDATDWKQFHVDDTTRVNVTIYWDDPDIEAYVEMRDAFGTLLGQRPHAIGQRVDQFGADLGEGDYFLGIVAQGGSSVYTLELSTGEASGGGGGGGSSDRPE